MTAPDPGSADVMGQRDAAGADGQFCHGCGERPWEVRFSWSYTGPEQYCRPCLEPILGFMPDCQEIVFRSIRGDWSRDDVRTVGRTMLHSLRELVAFLGKTQTPLVPRGVGE